VLARFAVLVRVAIVRVAMTAPAMIMVPFMIIVLAALRLVSLRMRVTMRVPMMVSVAIVVSVAMVMGVAMVMVMGVVSMLIVVVVAVIVRMAVVAFGLERRRHGCRGESTLLEQHRNVSVRGHAQTVGEDLHRHVAVSQREHQTRCLDEVLLAHFEDRFDVGHDLDQPAVVERQQVVGAQQRGRREIELDAGTLRTEYEALLLRAVFVFEQNRVDDLTGRLAGTDDFLGTRHGQIPIQ
jgi:hypothetical protein